MKTIVLTIKGSNRVEKVSNHLKSSGIDDFSIFYGINGIKSGLHTIHPYEIDNPRSNYKMGSKTIGCYLSHFILWKHLNSIEEHLDNDYWMIVEDDVLLLDGWRKKVDDAISDLPKDWDILYAGHCCINNRIHGHIRDGLVVSKPLCTHCYIVRKKALNILIDECEKVWAPIDIQMSFIDYNKLKSFAIYPKIADQDGTIISD